MRATYWQQRRAWRGQLFDNQPLLRSAHVPLPALFGVAPSTVAPPPWAVPVPLVSALRSPMQGCLPPALFDRLQAEVARQLWHTHVEHPEGVPIIGPMGNFPKPEVLFNTPSKRQCSRPCTAARAAPQGLERLCTGCWSGAGTRGAQCAHGGANCAGCDSCVGRSFLCPECGSNFERRWVYESGSGIGSIGRSPDQFEVFTFTAAQEAAAQVLDVEVRHRAPHGPEQRPLRSCVQVAYLGAALCGACALCQPHGSKQCGTVLHAHRDRGGGVNSQAATPNHTLSVGAPRTLHMELRLPHAGGGGGGCSYTTASGQGAEAHFVLTHGSEFTLEPRDEELLPRAVGDGSTAMGSFFHGMEREVGRHSVSCALVFRDVTSSAEVDMASNCVIQTYRARRRFETCRLPRGLANRPPWVPTAFRGTRGTRAEAFALTRQWWKKNAPLYAAKIAHPLRGALAEWTTADRARLGTQGAVAPAEEERQGGEGGV